jgi:predicted oxidoreductase (fatty acid repression mutant protein)
MDKKIYKIWEISSDFTTIIYATEETMLEFKKNVKETFGNTILFEEVEVCNNLYKDYAQYFLNEGFELTDNEKSFLFKECEC